MNPGSPWLRVVLRLASVAGIGLAVWAVPAPTLLAQEEEERCPGQALPVCRETTSCVGFPYNNICTTEFFYFPDPE